MKHCNTCNHTKEDTDFHKRAASPDGLAARCKKCQQAYDRNRLHLPHRVKQRDDYRIARRGSPDAHKGKKEWAERNPHKRSAHIAVGNAIRDGIIVDPCVCSKCQKAGKTEAHHDDYSKPLDVRWLCIECHAEHHIMTRYEMVR